MAKITDITIEQKLQRFDLHDINEEVFGVAVNLDENGRAHHSGLVLCFEEQKFFFHFNGKEVQLLDVTDNNVELYFKKLDLFPFDYFPFIKAHFETSLESVHPTYGFVFTDSFYENEKYISDIEHLPDFCTCVGFCLNMIRSIFPEPEKKYIEINDWDSSSLENVDERYISYVEHHLAKIAALDSERLAEIRKSTYKRINPIELLISAFIADPKTIPVRKKDISPHIMSTTKILQEKWLKTD